MSTPPASIVARRVAIVIFLLMNEIIVDIMVSWPSWSSWSTWSWWSCLRLRLRLRQRLRLVCVCGCVSVCLRAHMCAHVRGVWVGEGYHLHPHVCTHVISRVRNSHPTHWASHRLKISFSDKLLSFLTVDPDPTPRHQGPQTFVLTFYSPT
jgi:hypothetical protein